MFNRNLGSIDRSIRVLVGLWILSLAFVGPQTPWGYLGMILITTGLISWCPAYLPFGIKTCKVK